MSESFSIPTPGDVIAGKYRVMEELGRGAYGVVFRAEQIGLDRSVALKTLLPQAFLQVDIVQRFHREAQLISLLDHENVIKLYDYGVDEGLLYMAVEYVEGRTLADLMKAEAPVPPSKAREIVDQIIDALQYAHGQGVVHRDLKPDNILLLRSRPLEGIVEEVVKILDFGIAKLVLDEQGEGALKTLTQDGTVLGTPHYMSPENIVGDVVDHRTDLYALGVIMFELLVGEHPFEAPSPSAVMVRHLRDDAPRLPAPLTGTSFDVAILGCLEKQPDDRIGSALDVLEVLNSTPMPDDIRLAPRSPAQAEAEEIAEVAATSSSSKNVSLAVIAAMLVFLAVSVGWKLWYATTPEEPVKTRIAVPEVDLGSPPVVVAPKPDAGEPEDSVEGFEFGEDAGEVAETEPESEKPVVDRPKARKVESATKPQKKEEPEEVETVQIRVSSDPPRATVTIDGVPVGNTPVNRKWKKEDRALTVRVSLLGYKNAHFKVAPNEDLNIDAKLEFERIKMFD